MEKFQKFIEKHVIPLTEKIGQQRHLQSIRDGIIHVLPLILIGSLFLLIGQPPGKFLQNLVKPYIPQILVPFRLTFGLISVYVVGAIAYSLARSYDMDGVSTGITATVAFFLTATPRNVQDGLSNLFRVSLSEGDKPEWVLPMKFYGTEGLFLAIIIALLTVEILRFLKSKKLMFTMPEGVPEGVTRAFEAIIPTTLIIALFWVIRDILKFDAPTFVIYLFKPIQHLGDSYIATLVLTVIDSVVWFAGIHPVSIIGPFARPIWLQLLTENAEVMAAAGGGKTLPHIAVDQFYFWFMWVGGSGATLGLVLQLLFVKSKFLRQLGKMCLLPGLFNINEPLVFGLPIVANPLMIIPFTLAPIAGGSVAYLAFKLQLVQRPFISAPWTLPAPFGAFVSTGGDWKAVLLSVIVIIIAGLVYYPFIRVYDRQMLEREQAEEEENDEREESEDS